MGEAARKEARLAVELDPDSALAQKTLADILEYDLVGRRFQPGSKYAGAAAASETSLIKNISPSAYKIEFSYVFAYRG
jgi:hypothetical protein